MDPIYGNRTDSRTRRDQFLRWSILVSAAIASIGLSGCGPPQPPDLTGIRLTDLKPRAGVVERHGKELGGSWMLIRAPTGGGIISDGTAGACLLVAMRDVPGYGQMQCTGATKTSAEMTKDQNSACGPWPPGTVEKPWFAYCDLPDGAAAGAVGQCWGKPFNRGAAQTLADKQSCNRSIDHNPQQLWTPGVSNAVNQDRLDLLGNLYSGLAKPSHWRINACVRQHPGEISPTNVSICAWGTIKEIQ